MYASTSSTSLQSPHERAGVRPERHRARPSPVARIRLRESVPSCPWRGSTAAEENPRASPRWSASIFQGRCRFAGQHPLIHVLTFPQAPSELCRRPRLPADRVQPADQSPRLLGAIDRSLRHRSGRTTPGSGPSQRARQDVATFRRATGRVTGTLPDARFGSIAARTAVRLPRRRRTKLSARRPDVPASRRPCVRTVSWGTAVVSPIHAAHRSGSPPECDASRVRRRSSPLQASSRPLRRSPCP